MAEGLETFREVGHALQGVRTEIRIYAGVAVFAFLVACGVTKVAFDKLDRIEETIAEVKGITTKTAGDASHSRVEIGEVKMQLANAVPSRVYTPSPQEELLLSKLGTIGLVASNSEVQKFGDLKAATAALTDDQRTQIKTACMDALKSPEPFQLYLIGVCAAVNNQ